jgi:hypothetical protein
MEPEPVNAWKLPALVAYFDSGLYPRAGDPNAIVRLGFAVFRPGASSWREAITATSTTCLLGGAPAGFWELELPRLGPEQRNMFAASRAGRGLEFYDLVAARGLAFSLSANKFVGDVEMFTDNEQVIRFLNGEDSALTLWVGDLEIGRDLRKEVLAPFGPEVRPAWTRVPRDRNLADQAMKSMHEVSVQSNGAATMTLPGGPTYPLRGPIPDSSGPRPGWFRRLIGR